MQAANPKRPKVLVVDDDPLICSLVTDALQIQALEVITAADAEAALQRARSDAPEIVILDLRLPGLDGMEALRRLKEIAPQLPVIILTGYGDVSSAVEAMRLGAYDFLTKPVEVEKILALVRRALERQALGTEINELRNKLRQRDTLTRTTIRLQCLPFCSLPLQEECLGKLTFATNLERSEVFVPRAVRRLRLRFAPQFQPIKVFSRYLPIRDPIEQVLPETRWKIGPPNLRHQSPNVIRASSSFKRCRSAASRDSVSRFTSKKKRSFSASRD